MKKNLLLALALLVAGFSSSIAQDRKNTIKINIWSPVVSTLNLSYERVIAEKTSFQLGLAFTTKNYDDTKFRGFQIQPELRFYLSQKSAPAGFYVAPFFRYRSLSLEAPSTDIEYQYDEDGFIIGSTTVQSTAKGTWNQVGGGLAIGGQWLFADERVAFNIFCGPAFYGNSIKAKDGASENSFALRGDGGFSFRSGVSIGFAF